MSLRLPGLDYFARLLAEIRANWRQREMEAAVHTTAEEWEPCFLRPRTCGECGRSVDSILCCSNIDA